MPQPTSERSLPVMFAFLVCLLALWASPVNADCVSCGPGGECVTAPPGYSANCECRIRSTNGASICIPHGVCDPTDATSCDGTSPQNLVSGAKPRISTQFTQRLADKNPRLAGVLLGVLGEINSATEVPARVLTGTIGEAGKSYHFQARITPLAAGALSLTVRIEEDRTRQSEDFEAAVLDQGRSGKISQVERAGRTDLLSWKDSQ
jgi:hypothetical protein